MCVKIDILETVKNLYDQDFELWLSQTLNQLENQQFDQLDLEHLIEELTDLGKSNKRSHCLPES